MVVQYLVKNIKKLLKVSHDKKLARYETSKIFKVKENSTELRKTFSFSILNISSL